MNKRDFIWLGALILLAIIFSTGMAWAFPSPPKEQYPGHISANDLHDGITQIDMKVHGEWVSCIYAQSYTTRYASGVALSCDWNNQRR